MSSPPPTTGTAARRAYPLVLCWPACRSCVVCQSGNHVHTLRGDAVFARRNSGDSSPGKAVSPFPLIRFRSLLITLFLSFLVYTKYSLLIRRHASTPRPEQFLHERGPLEFHTRHSRSPPPAKVSVFSCPHFSVVLLPGAKRTISFLGRVTTLALSLPPPFFHFCLLVFCLPAFLVRNVDAVLFLQLAFTFIRH